MLHLKVLQNYLQPSVEILHIRIDEPVTTATDLLLAAISLYAFFKIRNLDYTAKIKWYFKYYFLSLGLGAAFGGLLGHGFQYRLAEGWKLVSWVLTLGSVALMAQGLLEMSNSLVKPGFLRIVSRLNLLVFLIALFLTLWTMAFLPVTCYTIFGMLVVVGSFSFYIYRKTGHRGMLVLMGALAVGFLSAIVFIFKWGLSPWFNHRDISHVILSISALGLYKGARLIMDGSLIST